MTAEERKNYNKKYYAEHREHYGELSLKWRHEHPERARETARKFYRKHRESVLLHQKDYWKNGGKEKRIEKRQPIKDFVNNYKTSRGCAICGAKDLPPECYDFHHLDPNIKDKDLGTITHSYSIEKVIDEMSKCIVVCANCHRQLTSGRITFNAHEI